MNCSYQCRVDGVEAGAVTIRVDGWRGGSSHGVASMAYTMLGRRDAVDATPHRLDARATSFTHREFELYHFSRSPFARAFFSISSASSSSRHMSGLSARSGRTLSKLSVPSAKAFAPAIRNLRASMVHPTQWLISTQSVTSRRRGSAHLP